MKEWITGRNPVYEVLQANRRHFFRARIASGIEENGRISQILGLLQRRKIPVERVPRQNLDQLAENHQGVAVESSAYPYSTLKDILDSLKDTRALPFLLILDELQDPQNLGTLLRTAEAVGIQGIIIPPRHSVGVTPAVVHASSGATEHLLIAAHNLAQAIQLIKEENIWVIGLEYASESQPVHQVRLDGPLAIVVGSEGQGMRSLVKKSCDQLAYLPMVGKIGSLNASVAGSIGLYLALQARQRTEK